MAAPDPGATAWFLHLTTVSAGPGLNPTLCRWRRMSGQNPPPDKHGRGRRSLSRKVTCISRNFTVKLRHDIRKIAQTPGNLTFLFGERAAQWDDVRVLPVMDFLKRLWDGEVIR